MRFLIKVDRERCKGCVLCVSACPRGVLAMAEVMNSSGRHFVEVRAQQECSGCRQCTTICPDAAIEIDVIDASSGNGKDRLKMPAEEKGALAMSSVREDE